jgi:predicted Fe-S protein YdhL (DUF1289 family)
MIDLLSLDTKHLTPEGNENLRQIMMTTSKTNLSLDDDHADLDATKSTLDHFCLRIDPFDEANLVKYFEEDQKIPILKSGLRKGAEGVGPSLYIQDPEGNVIELKGPSTIPSSSPKEEVSETDNRQSNVETTPDSVAGSEVTSTADCSTNATLQEPEDATTFPNNDDQATATTPVPSTPCTRICRYNADFYSSQVCIGCCREAYEIGTWGSMTAQEKYFCLSDAADRADEEGISFDGSISQEELSRQARYWQNK